LSLKMQGNREVNSDLSDSLASIACLSKDPSPALGVSGLELGISGLTPTYVWSLENFTSKTE